MPNEREYIRRRHSYRVMKILFFGSAAFAFSIAMTPAAETRFESGPTQTALVELYTSEGCSSCPPAEAWLSRQKENPGLWKQFVPLAFHVDYWDRLGWRDRFSSKKWTERQSRYAALWRSESVYTPAVVVNGREVRNWSSSNPSRPNETKTGRLSARTSDGKSFTVEFQPDGGSASSWQVHAALLGSGISSKIGGGENGGRNLQHDFVVLELREADMKTEGGAAHARLTFEEKGEPRVRPAIAIWVTAGNQLAPVQATGGWLL